MSAERKGLWRRLMSPTHRRDEHRELWMFGGPRSRWVHLVLSVVFWSVFIVVVLVARNEFRGSGIFQPWFWLLLGVFWIGYAVHAWLQASTGTTILRDRIVVRDRRRVTEVPWTDVVRIRLDLESRWASHLVAELQDGTEVQLAMVPLAARDAVLAWAPPSVERRG